MMLKDRSILITGGTGSFGQAFVKIHKEMITASDSFNTVDLGHYFAILPMTGNDSRDQYRERNGCECVPEGFVYNSGSNPEFLTVEELRKLIRLHVDPEFQA